MDMIANYISSKSWKLRPNIVLVEGTTDEQLFTLADTLSAAAGCTLLGEEVSVVAAGRRDRGGTFGVARELITLRSMVPLVLNSDGGPAYRVVGVVDNDNAGRRIIDDVTRLDRGALEFRDIVALRPITPIFTEINPSFRKSQYDHINLPHQGLDWEIEDAISSRLLSKFEQKNNFRSPRKTTIGGKTHRVFSPPAKMALHQFVQNEATLEDVADVIEIVSMIRSMLGLSVSLSH